MKTYEETTQRVFQRIEEQNALRNQKKRSVMHATLTACPICIAALAGVGIWQLSDKPLTAVTEPSQSAVCQKFDATTPPREHQVQSVPLDSTAQASQTKTSVCGRPVASTPTLAAHSTPLGASSSPSTQPTVTVPSLYAATTPQSQNKDTNGSMGVCDNLIVLEFQENLYVEIRNEAFVSALTTNQKLGTIAGWTTTDGKWTNTDGGEDAAVYSVKEFDDVILLMLADGERLALRKQDLTEDVQALVSLEIDGLLYVEERGWNEMTLTPKNKYGKLAELIASGTAQVYTGFGKKGTVLADDAQVYSVQGADELLLVIQPNGTHVILSRM